METVLLIIVGVVTAAVGIGVLAALVAMSNSRYRG